MNSLHYPWPKMFDSYYGALGLMIDRHPLTDKPILPGVPKIRSYWRDRMKSHHPMAFGGLEEIGEDSVLVQTFRAIMEAWEVLRSGRRCEYDEVGHSTWITSNRRDCWDAEIEDWQVILLRDVLDVIEPATGPEEYVEATKKVAPQLGLLPDYLRADRLQVIPELNVEEFLDELLPVEDDLEHLADYDFTWRWRRNPWGSHGTVGQAKPIPKAERQRWPGGERRAPHGRIELALDYWLAMDQEGRRALVFHELLHFGGGGKDAVKSRPHSLEAFAAEIRRFGVTRKAQAEFLAAALEHDDLLQQIQRFDVPVRTQLGLFSDEAK